MQGYRPRRRPSDLRVTVESGGARRDVRLLDVSETGLKVAWRDPPPAGDAVDVSTPRLALRARVQWAEHGATGLRLSQPLPPSEQEALSGMTWGS